MFCEQKAFRSHCSDYCYEEGMLTLKSYSWCCVMTVSLFVDCFHLLQCPVSKGFLPSQDSAFIVRACYRFSEVIDTD